MIKEELEKLSIEHIKVFETFEESGDCPFCKLIERLENKVLNAISEELVMDLDFFPKFGHEYTFCDYHMGKMEGMRDKLGMAIMLKKLVNLELRKMNNIKQINGSGFFQKRMQHKKCYVCEKVNGRAIENYVSSAMELWNDKKEFKELYRNQQYFCFKHFKLISSMGKKYFDRKKYNEFMEDNFHVEKCYCETLEKDLEWFINKFDYRYKEEPWYNAKDSIYRARSLLRGDKE